MSTRDENSRESTSREIQIVTNYTLYPEGSALYVNGNTRVLCNVSIDNRVKDFLRGMGKGWITAEYSMLPRATSTRNDREGWKGRWPRGRSQEIQRIIGRSLRASVWPERLGERTFIVDCDVIQADGGTRTSSVNGGFIALALALSKEIEAGRVRPRPFRSIPAAVSVGIVENRVLMDMNHAEDQSAQVDLNVVGTEDGKIIEVQGTAEREPFSRSSLDDMIDAALKEILNLCELHRSALMDAGVDLDSMVELPQEK